MFERHHLLREAKLFVLTHLSRRALWSVLISCRRARRRDEWNSLTTQVHDQPLDSFGTESRSNSHRPDPTLHLLRQQVDLPPCGIFDLFPVLIRVDGVTCCFRSKYSHVCRRHAKVGTSDLEALQRGKDFINGSLRDRTFLVGVRIILGIEERYAEAILEQCWERPR